MNRVLAGRERNIRSVTALLLNLATFATMRRTTVSSLAAFVALALLLNSAPAMSQTTNPATDASAEIGQRLYREGKYQDALNLLKKAVQVNSNNADAWYYLGATSLKLNDFKNATKAFDRASNLEHSSRAHSGLAYSFLLRNKLKEGFKEAEQAVALDANSFEAHFVLGVSYMNLGEREKALAEADRTIQLNKNFADAYLLKSQALVQSGRGVLFLKPDIPPEERGNTFQEAASTLQTYLQLAPNTSDKTLWTQQLESLNFQVAMRSKATREQNNVYTSKAVTTKAQLIKKPEPTYTGAARSNGIEGTVILRALFAADGTVKHIVVIEGLPHGLTWQAVQAAQKIKFTPATLNGRPVGMFMQLEYNFNLY